MTTREERLHLRALELSRQHRKLESQMIQILQEIEISKLHRKMGYTSLFKYACDELGLNEPIAFSFISVARTAYSVPALQQALQDERISVSRASRIVSAIDNENACELIEFATTHSMRETDFEVARRNPRVSRDRMRVLSEDRVEISVSVSKETYEALKRAQDLMSHEQNVSLGEVLEKITQSFLDRRDPVRKAQRARSRKLCANRVPAKIDARHEVHERDGGRCTFIDRNGNRCTNERWLHLHHIRPRSKGGPDTAENLATLCAAHHDLVHQLQLPGFLKDSTVAYKTGPAVRS